MSCQSVSERPKPFVTSARYSFRITAKKSCKHHVRVIQKEKTIPKNTVRKRSSKATCRNDSFRLCSGAVTLPAPRPSRGLRRWSAACASVRLTRTALFSPGPACAWGVRAVYAA